MRRGVWQIGLALAIGLMIAGVAQATPFVTVSARWNLQPGTLPDGISLSCLGTAVANGSGGCSDSLSLSTTVAGTQTFDISSVGGLTVTNTTDHQISGAFPVSLAFSAFNPGGPNVGLSIDDPANQAASFHSSVSGTGVADSHGCSIGFAGASGTVLSSRTCGVMAPDESHIFTGINFGSLAPNDSAQFVYVIHIAADFRVPEPATALILAMGLAGFAAGRKRRA